MGHYRGEMISETEEAKRVRKEKERRKQLAENIKETIAKEGIEYVLADILIDPVIARIHFDSVNAYKRKVRELSPERLVQIDRRNAPSVTGAVQKIEDSGISIKENKKGDIEGEVIFIAYADICGVSEAGWNYEVIGQ